MSVLAAEQVSFRIGAQGILADISLTLRGGEFLALVGPNGAGKTSLLRLMAGLVRTTTGRVTLDGLAIGTLPPRVRGRRIAFLAPARIAIPGAYRVDDVVRLARFAHHSWWHTTGRDDPAVERALERFELGAFRDRVLGSLSDGERQRVWLATVEAQEPEIILLDEPTSHLDVAYVADTLRAVRKWAADGRGVIAVVHDLDAALAAADRLVVLRKGRLVVDVAASDLELGVLSRSFDIELGAATVARRRRGLVIDYEAER